MLPSSPTGKSISYALDQWSKLTYFLQDGSVPIDNNYLEAHIRPFTIGRKNWMFSVSPSGANASAALYTLVETCKANRIEPLSYLKVIFTELPKAQNLQDYEKLLPYNAGQYFALKGYNPSSPIINPN